MTIENCNINAKVDQTYDRLIKADSHNIRAVFDDVFDDMQGSTRQARMQFVQLLNQKLELSGNLPQVLVETARYEFDKINDGHSRVKDRALKDRALEFHNEDRLLEETLVNDMLQSESLMKKEKHEGKFLGMGNKSGVDLARLETHVAKSNDRMTAESALRNLGTDDEWRDVTQGRGYLTRDYINHRINQNLVTQDLQPEQLQALTYLNDKNNFKHASKDVPVYTTPDGATTYERRITQTSLENFVGKKFYGTGYEYVNNNPQSGVRDRQGAGWRAMHDYDNRVDEFDQRSQAIDQACANPVRAEIVKPVIDPRRLVRDLEKKDNCGCNAAWQDTFTES